MKRKTIARVLTLVLVLAVLLGVFSGCGTTDPEITTAISAETATSKPETEPSETSASSAETEPEVPDDVKAAFEFCSEFLEKRAKTEYLNEDQGLHSYVPDEEDESYRAVYYFVMLAECLGKCNEFEELLAEDIKADYSLESFTKNENAITVTLSESLQWTNSATKENCEEINVFRLEASAREDGFKIEDINAKSRWNDYNELKNEDIDWEKKLRYMLYNRGYVPDFPGFEGSRNLTELEGLPEDIADAYVFAMEFFEKISRTEYLYYDEALYEYLPEESEWYYRGVYDFIMSAELMKALRQYRGLQHYLLDVAFTLEEYEVEYGRIILSVYVASSFFYEPPYPEAGSKPGEDHIFNITLLPTDEGYQIMNIDSPWNWGMYEYNRGRITDWNAELKRCINWQEGDPFEPIEPLVP